MIHIAQRKMLLVIAVFCIALFGVAIAGKKKNDSQSATLLISAIHADRADDKSTDEQLIGDLKGLLKDIDVNAQDAKGWTALMAAAKKGSLALVDYLVDNGADIEKKNTGGQTALDIANEWQQKDVASYLLAVDKFKKGGWTALDFGDTALVKLFVEKKKLDVNAKDSTGKTVLMEAAKYGYKHIVKLLLEKGANVNAIDDNGNTPLIYAAKYGEKVGSPKIFKDSTDFLPVVELLIAYQANLDARNNKPTLINP